MWLGGFLAGGLFRVPSVMGLEVMFLMDDRLTLGTTHVPFFFFFFSPSSVYIISRCITSNVLELQ